MTNDLFSPLTFRSGRCAKNRVVLAPMTNLQSHLDGTLGEDELRWILRRAEGGFGTVETCAAHVAADGQSWKGQLGIHDDAMIPGLTRLAAALRGAGAVAVAQLFHGGARADAALIGARPWSASAIPGDANDPRAASTEEVIQIIAAFRDAAVRAHRAGFDGVELHGAHGYLLGQFLSRLNVRTDGWGGPDFPARARLLREVTRAVRAAVPASFLIGVRVSPEDWGNARGLDLDESLTLAGWLADDGIDFLHLSLWTASNRTKKRPDAHSLTLFRAACPADLPLIVAGKVWTQAEAEALLALGADAVALGRSAIANPDWPARYQADPRWEPKRPPLTPAELRERALSDGFIEYMRIWKGFITD